MMTPYEALEASNFPRRAVQMLDDKAYLSFYGEKKGKVAKLIELFPTNLIINGACGSGKTVLATMLATTIYRNRSDLSRYESAQQLTMWIEKTRFAQDNSICDDLTNTTDILFIDEFLARKYSDHELDFFQAVIDSRYNDMLTTVIITNLTLEDMVNQIGQKFVDRLTHEGHVLSLNQANGRKQS